MATASSNLWALSEPHGEVSRNAFEPEFEDEGSPLAFGALLLLIFVIYIAPQVIFPVLEPLHLAKVSAALAVVAYVTWVWRNGAGWTFMSREVRLMLILIGIALISIPFSLWPGGSLQYLIDQYSKSIIIFFLVANVLTSFRRYRILVWAMSVFAAFNAFQGTKHYVAGEVWKYGRVLGGASSIAGNPNDLALVLNLSLPFLFYLYETARSMRQRVLVVLLIGIDLGGIITSFSRGGFLTLVAIVLWTAWVVGKRKGTGVFVKTCAVVLVCGLVLAVAGPSGYGDRVASIGDMSKDQTGSSNARWNLMVGTAQGMLLHPLGVGLHMNNVLLHETGYGWEGVHNVYLELGTEIGIPGLAVLLWLLYRLISSMKEIRLGYEQVPELSALAQAAGGAMVAFVTAGMFHPVAFHFYLYIVAGLVIACQQLALRVDRAMELEAGRAEFG
ncbi:membrane hypothetical protein [Candidatus Nitrospira nitrosa]|uniref:O-antigen ligase-related domain-containing protein n=1 Tax=Candidatus Nitrospira nitrosa TaxID=1742972 RepID=A0A0S4LUU7_9BACT|nr:O-antigen ligase family protein [Candidatus Nitrospira nitrosa]CUS38786.1 membrane hypothetical protein [Candidatus Nitrospira nitrosa]